MIENRLQREELRNLLAPALRLEPITEVLKGFASALRLPATASADDVLSNGSVLLRYGTYTLGLQDIGSLGNEGTFMLVGFRRVAKGGLLGTFDVARQPHEACRDLIDDLKAVCQEEIEGITFQTSRDVMPATVSDSAATEEPKLVFDCVHVAEAVHRGAVRDWHDWDRRSFRMFDLKDMSPLLIGATYGDGVWSVAFSFDPVAFERVNGKTTLRADFEDYTQGRAPFSRGDRHARTYHVPELAKPRWKPIDLGTNGVVGTGCILLGAAGVAAWGAWTLIRHAVLNDWIWYRWASSVVLAALIVGGIWISRRR